MSLSKRAPVYALLTLIAFVLVNTAWLSEDIYITLRVVDNFVNGYGLTWNVAERVQAYTHPLWLGVITAAYALTGEAYYTLVFLCLGVSVCSICLMALGLAPTTRSACLMLVLMLFSKAFVDYSTSGLENPLTHLLLAIFAFSFLDGGKAPRDIFLRFLIAGAILLTRQDLFLILLPPLAMTVVRSHGPRALAAAAAGLVPVALWHAFSLFYYGFPFPNTAYAKLNIGIDTLPLIRQGLYYLKNSLVMDPVTLLTIAGAGAAAVLRRNLRLMVLSAGAILYVVYVARIGGDWMSGRFLSAPFVCAVIVLGRIGWSNPRLWLTVLVGAVGIGILSPYPPIFSDVDYGRAKTDDEHRVDDLRARFYPIAGLVPTWKNGGEPLHEWVDRGRLARQSGERFLILRPIGYTGYYAGPGVHIVDAYALTDPLLARLPTNDVVGWYVGHFSRLLPTGYWETVVSGKNEIMDDKLALYYDKLAVAIQGPLWDASRLREIWRLNTGTYRPLLNFPYHRKLALALHLVRAGRADEGLAVMEEAVALDPERAAAWYYLAKIQDATRNVDAARASLSRAAELDPRQPIYRQALASPAP